MLQTAEAVLVALGGQENILANTVCMTRLRVTLRNPEIVDFEALHEINSVLGTSVRGKNGVEVVFGPRVIDAVYHAFLDLTGLEASTDALFPMSRQNTNLQVQIYGRSDSSQSESTSPKRLESPSPPRKPTQTELDDYNELADLFYQLDESEARGNKHPKTFHLLVLNGPGINLYSNYSQILNLCQSTAEEVGFKKCVCLQSDHENTLIDWICTAQNTYDALVLNPTAYGLVSTALSNTVRRVSIPIASVSVNAIVSPPSSLISWCTINIMGKGIAGYALAIRQLASIL